MYTVEGRALKALLLPFLALQNQKLPKRSRIQPKSNPPVRIFLAYLVFKARQDSLGLVDGAAVIRFGPTQYTVIGENLNQHAYWAEEV